jgi:hypothetical protein
MAHNDVRTPLGAPEIRRGGRTARALWRTGGRVADIDILFAGVAVADFGAAVGWYGRVFGRPADVVVTDNEVMWRIADAAWLYVIGD